MEQTNTANSYSYSYGCCCHRLPCGRCDVTGKYCYESSSYAPNWWDHITCTSSDNTTIKADYLNNNKPTDINSDANKMLRC